ncbi:MAG: M48 family metalloprotease [Acetobacteraceae bacterium]|nr:M48 family metalloprotease [Acetobacteraceae bacterium]
MRWSRIPGLAVVLALSVMAACFAPSGASAQGARASPIVIRDAETEATIRAFAAPLFAAAAVNPGMVRIILLQDRGLNAFVAQGNRLFLNSGLLQRTEAPEEFAGVLAHEIGHIAGGHLLLLPEQMRLAMLRQVGAMLLGGLAAAATRSGDAAMGAIMFGQATAVADLYAFTRAQEQAADQAAITYLARAGWPLGGLESLLVRMLDQELLQTSRQDPYFRTHPLSRDRLEFVREQRARLGERAGALPPALVRSFRMVQAKLDGFLDPPETTFARRPPDSRDPADRYARAIAEHRAGRADAGLALLAGLLREAPGSPWLHELRGQILFEAGRLAEALPAYRQAARLAPSEPLIRLNLARVLIETGEPANLRAAAADLRAALSRDREDAFAWRLLGIAEGRLGNRAEADVALAEEALLRGDAAGARTLAARAEQAFPPGPARLRAADLRRAAEQALGRGG